MAKINRVEHFWKSLLFLTRDTSFTDRNYLSPTKHAWKISASCNEQTYQRLSEKGFRLHFQITNFWNRWTWITVVLWSKDWNRQLVAELCREVGFSATAATTMKDSNWNAIPLAEIAIMVKLRETGLCLMSNFRTWTELHDIEQWRLSCIRIKDRKLDVEWRIATGWFARKHEFS